MSCNNCDSNPLNIPVTLGLFSTNCSPNEKMDIKDYAYMGPDLSCSGISTGTSITDAIQKLDSKLCGVLGDFSTYDTACLTTSDGSPILTQQEFVESSSKAICDDIDDLAEFKGIFSAYKDVVNNRFKAIEIPGTVSTTQGILATSTIQNTLSVLSASIDNILNVKLSLAGVPWNECFVVSPLPTTIAQAFTIVENQLCSLKDDIVDSGLALPTFNNVGSTLPGPVTAADTLVSTVNKIKTRVDQIPTFDINALSWGCTTKPSALTYNLQSAFQSVLDTTNDYRQNKLTFSSDFTVTATGGGICGGKTISLAISPTADRYVATNVSDTTPGTLSDKLQQGTGISLDYSTTPGKVIINSTGSAGGDKFVKVNVSDPSGGYLEDKIAVVTNSSGVTVTKTTNTTTNKVDLSTNVNAAQLWNTLLTFLDTNPATYAEFCERVSGCLPDCVIPPNVTVIYNTSTSSTTTTTTTSGGA